MGRPRVIVAICIRSPSCLISTCWEAIFSVPLREVCHDAALQVLRSAGHPLTAREITDRAVEGALIRPRGKTPHATMGAKLYVWARNDPELVKLEAPGNG